MTHSVDTRQVNVTYCGKVVIWTKAGVDAPHSSILAKKLCIEEGIHFDQQSFPVALSFQECRVGQSLAIETSALHEEPAFLQHMHHHGMIHCVSKKFPSLNSP